MADKVKVNILGEVIECEAGTPILDIAKNYQKDYKYDIILSKVNGKLMELAKKIEVDSNLSFYTTESTYGSMTYKRTCTLVMLKAFYDVCGTKNIDKIVVQFSLSKGYYCTFEGAMELNEELLDKVEKHMHELVDAKLPIKKKTLSTAKAIESFKRHHMYDKEKLFLFRRSSNVNVYSLEGFEDYFYGYMAPDTSYIRYFKLYKYDKGFVIQVPTHSNPELVPEFKPQNKVFKEQDDSTKWNNLLNVANIGQLNEHISNGTITDMILVNEALQEAKIAQIAEEIVSRKGVKFIMIAGPSSSGKTTFSHRLSIQLRAHGLKPHPIEVDNYFVDRNRTPRDEKGEFDFENIDAIDIEQFNKDMTALSNGEKVEMPTFNFVKGEREYKGNTLQLEEDGILVIEGIHCLNDKFSYSLNKESKFKIYISALTTLNVDEHNRIATTDGRLIRRMVRDARTRGTSARDTIARWPSVRRGEERNIFPYQEDADVVFNSALIYELAVLKLSAEPLLFGIPRDCEEYYEAKRLLKFLDYFLGLNSENIPKTSLVREFIGGGLIK